MATGHYIASRRMADGSRGLFRARDEDRDQSYFLFATTRDQLDILRFPLGEKTKTETRELARQYGLNVADKHDSQDICFVPSGKYTDIIERLMPGSAEPGEIVDLAGNVLGTHAGIIHFTVGQRRGLGIAGTEPMYVIRLDAVTRRVVAGPRSALRTARLQLRDVNWIGDGTLDEALAAGRRELFVKVRSTRQPQPAWLTQDNGTAAIEFVDGEDGVAPGQACALYDAANGQSRVLGGGFIVSAQSQLETAQTRRIPEAATARL
jgi:tRNA-specific 2-thiouridylase